MRTVPARSRRYAPAVALLAVALLAACGEDRGPGLQAPGGAAAAPTSVAPGAAATPAPAAARQGPVFKAEKRWTDPNGNEFTILVTVNRPSNAGLSMCSMAGGRFLGPSLVLSVRNDRSARPVKGPQISVNDRMVAFPYGEDGNGCSFVYAPSGRETFKPGDSHTYRGMVVPWDGRFTDVVLKVSTRGKGGKLVTKELLRVPAAKLVEANRLGPPPGDPKTPAQTHHSH